jgi:hypothetical protein
MYNYQTPNYIKDTEGYLSAKADDEDGLLLLYTRNEYKFTPDRIREIVTGLNEWLDDLVRWECPGCRALNFTTLVGKALASKSYPFGWVRCQSCKQKFKRETLDLVKEGDKITP